MSSFISTEAPNVCHKLNVMVEGCCHGELGKIYQSIAWHEEQGAPKVDLLLICGDFQSIRVSSDLDWASMPDKYKRDGDFGAYCSGRLRAPVLTIFIGGNHEASNVLHSLYYGGWVAPNIYFLGYAGVVQVGGVRIAGSSGIFNDDHYTMGHYEQFPYNMSDIKSIYHTRKIEVFRLMQLCTHVRPIDIMMSHDWPAWIWRYGDEARLLRRKPFFRTDASTGRLGSQPYMDLLMKMQPRYWFAAHLHVKFAALVPHMGRPSLQSQAPMQAPADSTMPQTQNTSTSLGPTVTMCASHATRFLALDKPLPGREFLQFLQIPRPPDSSSSAPITVNYDPEWLAVLHKTHHLTETSRRTRPLHGDFTVSEDEIKRWTAEPIPEPTWPVPSVPFGNAQTDAFLAKLGLPHIWTVPLSSTTSSDHSPPPFPPRKRHGDTTLNTIKVGKPEVGIQTPVITDPNEIDIDDDL